jgi:hypothetical protein
MLLFWAIWSGRNFDHLVLDICRFKFLMIVLCLMKSAHIYLILFFLTDGQSSTPANNVIACWYYSLPFQKRIG